MGSQGTLIHILTKDGQVVEISIFSKKELDNIPKHELRPIVTRLGGNLKLSRKRDQVQEILRLQSNLKHTPAPQEHKVDFKAKIAALPKHAQEALLSETNEHATVSPPERVVRKKESIRSIASSIREKAAALARTTSNSSSEGRDAGKQKKHNKLKTLAETTVKGVKSYWKDANRKNARHIETIDEKSLHRDLTSLTCAASERASEPPTDTLVHPREAWSPPKEIAGVLHVPTEYVAGGLRPPTPETVTISLSPHNTPEKGESQAKCLVTGSASPAKQSVGGRNSGTETEAQTRKSPQLIIADLSGGFAAVKEPHSIGQKSLETSQPTQKALTMVPSCPSLSLPIPENIDLAPNSLNEICKASTGDIPELTDCQAAEDLKGNKYPTTVTGNPSDDMQVQIASGTAVLDDSELDARIRDAVRKVMITLPEDKSSRSTILQNLPWASNSGPGQNDILDAVLSRIAELEAQVTGSAELEARVTGLDDALEVERQRVTGLVDALENEKRRVTDLLDEVEDLTELLDDERVRITKLRKDVDVGRERTTELKKQIENLEDWQMEAVKDFEALAPATCNGQSIRDRFVENFVRFKLGIEDYDQDKVEDGNGGAHKGDCLGDALLWEGRRGQAAKRRPMEEHLFEDIYGVNIAIARCYRDFDKAKELINNRGTIAAAKYLTPDESQPFFDFVHKIFARCHTLRKDELAKAFQQSGWVMTHYDQSITMFDNLHAIEIKRMKQAWKKRGYTPPVQGTAHMKGAYPGFASTGSQGA